MSDDTTTDVMRQNSANIHPHEEPKTQGAVRVRVRVREQRDSTKGIPQGCPQRDSPRTPLAPYSRRRVRCYCSCTSTSLPRRAVGRKTPSPTTPRPRQKRHTNKKKHMRSPMEETKRRNTASITFVLDSFNDSLDFFHHHRIVALLEFLLQKQEFVLESDAGHHASIGVCPKKKGKSKRELICPLQKVISRKTDTEYTVPWKDKECRVKAMMLPIDPEVRRLSSRMPSAMSCRPPFSHTSASYSSVQGLQVRRQDIFA